MNIDHVEGVSDAYWLATGYRRLGDRVMRVDMAERLSAVIRAGAREGKFQISEEMMSLAGATRDQMAAILLDLNYLKVEEIPSEDPEKPAIPVFERKQRNRKPDQNADAPNRAKRHNNRAKRHEGKKPDAKRGQSTGNAQARKPKEADPNSPFAILAQLKSQQK